MAAPTGNTNAKRAWNADRDARLCQCVSNQMTGGETAKELNNAFGTTYSRNAVIGRAFRLRMRFQSRCAGPRSGKPPSPQCTAAASQKRSKPAPAPIHTRVATMPQFNRDGFHGLRCDEVRPQNVTLLELAPNGCRWPFGWGSPYTFCNHPQVETSQYCLDHLAMSVGRGTDSERRAHRVSDAA